MCSIVKLKTEKLSLIRTWREPLADWTDLKAHEREKHNTRDNCSFKDWKGISLTIAHKAWRRQREETTRSVSLSIFMQTSGACFLAFQTSRGPRLISSRAKKASSIFQDVQLRRSRSSIKVNGEGWMNRQIQSFFTVRCAKVNLLRMDRPAPHLTDGGKWQVLHGPACHWMRSCWTSKSKQERFSVRGGHVGKCGEWYWRPAAESPPRVDAEELDCWRTTLIRDWIESSSDWSEHWDHSDQSDTRHSSGQATVQLRIDSVLLSGWQKRSSTCWPSAVVHRTSRWRKPEPQTSPSSNRHGAVNWEQNMQNS